MSLTATEQREYIALLEFDLAAKVAPKLERFREPSRIKVAFGGRGAGAKSWSFASLLTQRANTRKTNILCTREIQLSLEESVHRLICNTVERLNFTGWDITREFIKSPKGSLFHFRGMKDLRSALAIKGLEDIDIVWFEEASGASNDSLDILFPTIRKKGSELWFSFNREEEMDPVYDRLIRNKRDDAMVVWLEPGKIDNPWWTDELQKEMDEDYKRDPDQAEHIWGGQPRSQGQKAVMSRTAVRGAMDRNIAAEGAIEVGVDVARFGDDLTVMYRRHGLKVVAMKTFAGQDTQRTASEAWFLADRNKDTTIKIDDGGVGGGVTDRLREFGAKVMPLNFGGDPQDKNGYTSVADEMWFLFPIDEADIPNDPLLMQELAGRRYDYDNKGRRKVEPKKDFKKRIGRSPDRADALLLTYYNRRPIEGVFENLENTGQLIRGRRGPQDPRWHLNFAQRR
jgi:phage terminase large subunit